MTAPHGPDDTAGKAEDAALLALGILLRDSGYRFSTVTPLTQARVNARPGNQWAKDPAGVFGWSRPFRANVLPDAWIELMRRAGVLAPVGGAWRSTVRLSTLGDMTFFHSAYPTTAGDSVFFGPDTCRFAEAIRTQLLQHRPPVTRAIDVGCGAGPGGILIAALAPAAEVVMVDINARALRLAAVNAALNGVPGCTTRHSNLFSETQGTFDLIVSNPPYLLDAAARAYRHGGGHRGEGLSVAILDSALPRLRPGGTILLYTGAAVVDGHDEFREQAEALLRSKGRAWSYREVDPDVFGEELESGFYADADRIAAVVLTVT